MVAWIREGGCCIRVEGNYLKYLNKGCNRKEQRRNKDFQIGGKLGQGVGALKGGVAGTPLQTMYMYLCIYYVRMYVYV